MGRGHRLVDHRSLDRIDPFGQRSIVAGRVADLRDGADLAARAIDSGAARQVLDRLVAATNEGSGGG